jgi:hypothetical protein
VPFAFFALDLTMEKVDPSKKQPTKQPATDADDDVSSDSHQTNTNDESNKTRKGRFLALDRGLLSSRVAAFFVLGLAAVGLGAMTFFLTRGQELDEMERQVSLFISA